VLLRTAADQGLRLMPVPPGGVAEKVVDAVVAESCEMFSSRDGASGNAGSHDDVAVDVYERVSFGEDEQRQLRCMLTRAEKKSPNPRHWPACGAPTPPGAAPAC
jgi:hypothetical protein